MSDSVPNFRPLARLIVDYIQSGEDGHIAGFTRITDGDSHISFTSLYVWPGNHEAQIKHTQTFPRRISCSRTFNIRTDSPFSFLGVDYVQLLLEEIYHELIEHEPS